MTRMESFNPVLLISVASKGDAEERWEDKDAEAAHEKRTKTRSFQLSR